MHPLNLRFYAAGYCTHPETITTPGGRWKQSKAYALCGRYTHPALGEILIDTGYTPRFYEATDSYPQKLYALMTPTTIEADQTLKSQLDIPAEEVTHIIITHFHADHIGGIKDFPNAKFVYFEEAYDAVRTLSPVKATAAAFLPSLLPDDFEARSQVVMLKDQMPLPLDLYLYPFTHGIDLFGDGRVWGIHLPGHAYGQMGLFITGEIEARDGIFLCADACWHSSAFRENARIHPITRFIQSDMGAYRTSLNKLHQLHTKRPDLPILPFHCPEVVSTWTHSEI